MKLTRARARKLSREWQERLCLRDWNVDVRVETIKNARGTISQFPEKQMAIMRVDPDREVAGVDRLWAKADHERTIVHELLHIHFTQAKRRGYHEEQAIHALACALVGLKRKSRRK